GDTARLDRAGDRRHRGDANYGDHPESDDGKQEVGDGASGDDGDALLDALAVECLTELLLGYRRFALVEHLHVAAQRDAGYGEFGAVTVAPAVQCRTETDGEAQHSDPATAGDPEMAVFMDGDQQPQCDHGGQQGK